MTLIDRAGVYAQPISFTSKSGLWLDGLLYSNPGRRNSGVVIHVHGSFGNFYTNRWLRKMAKIYLTAGFDFLTFNLSGHDGLAEGYICDPNQEKPRFTYVGHSITPFDTFIDDISGVVDGISKEYDRLVLQGHSQGCDRIVAYSRICSKSFPLVLLSPADTPQLYKNYVAPEPSESALNRWLSSVTTEPPFDWLPIEAYGVDEPPEEVYQIPISASALRALLVDALPYLLRIHDGADSYHLDIPAFVFIGARDGFQTTAPTVTFEYFKKRFKSVKECLVGSSSHELDKCVESVSREVISWIEYTFDSAGTEGS